jgi:hypothetical protein
MENPSSYTVEIGKFEDDKYRKVIDEIRVFILNNYLDKLKERSSFHQYIVNTDQKLQQLVNEIRYSKNIIDNICSQYKNCDITSLDNTDELYISHYNIDGGGDQGLYNKHYDGVLRIIKNATVVRALIYINSNDDFVVHFLDSNISHNFQNYEYGILDFNREYHFVEGKYNEEMNYKDSRILLKLNYLVCPKCSKTYTEFIIFINYIIFFIVKASMEYSKSPKTIFQYIIGFFCNLFRIVNNVSVYFTILLVIFLLFVLYMLFHFIIKYIFYLKNNYKKIIKTIKKY